ncbi:hexokinase-domain-containing protein [Phellopilus nigrolimitatus]|nr:hexokinase-domain-containing protein [Phellopilus nigrolimitatus]
MPPTPASSSTSTLNVPDATRSYLEGVEKQFHLSDEKLLAITHQFVDDFALGLGEYNKPMAMIPTFVTGVPDGTEKGTFLALDLGGTNLRVCEVQLHGNKEFTLRQQKYKVSDMLKTGEATVLFDYLADSVDEFLTTMGHTVHDDEALHLGLTFSFPVEQTALDKGVLLTWTKGFAAKNAVGNDVVKLLQDAFDRKHIHVKCSALVNDTVGALLSRAYATGGCLLGCIFGTGTNGAYVEDVHKIQKLANSSSLQTTEKMLVNTEWGAFNNTRSVLPSTPHDNKLDRESINPRFQAYEKFISGMYLGEITRNLLLSFVDAAPPLLFNGSSTSILNQHYGFDTAYMSDIENAQTLEDIKKVLVEKVGFQIDAVSNQDAEIVRWACQQVATRAAYLSGCAVGAVLVQTGNATLGGGRSTNERKFAVGVDGSLIQFYPNFESRLRDSLRAIVGEDVERKVEIGLARDGSGVGAALCALQALKQEQTGTKAVLQEAAASEYEKQPKLNA